MECNRFVFKKSFTGIFNFTIGILFFDLFWPHLTWIWLRLNRYSWWIKHSLCNFWPRAIKFITRSIHWWKFRVSDWFNLCWPWSRTNFEYFGSETSTTIPKWRETLFNWFGSIKFWPIKKPKYRPHSQVHQIMIVHELNVRIVTSRLFIHFHWNIQECNSTCSFFNFAPQMSHRFFYFLECRT